MKPLFSFFIIQFLLLLNIPAFSQVKRLVDLCPELTNTFGYYLSRVGDNIYFVGQDTNLDTNLYEYGPANGLKKIKGTFLPSRYWGVSFYFQNATYFWGYETTGMDPGASFKYDGNGNAVRLDKLGNLYGSSQAVIFKNKLYYLSYNVLYSFDGIDTINCSSGIGTITNLAVTDNFISFFTYINSEFALCKYDGSTLSLYKNSKIYNPTFVGSYNNEIYFNNFDQSSGYQLWKFNGNSIQKLTSIGSYPQGLSPTMFTNFKSNLCFVGSDENGKPKIWLYNDSCGAIPIHDYSLHSAYANTKVIDTAGNYLFFIYDNYSDSKIGMFQNNHIQYVPLDSNIINPLNIGATSMGLFFTAKNSSSINAEIFYYKPPDVNVDSTKFCESGQPPFQPPPVDPPPIDPVIKPEFMVYPCPVGVDGFDIKTNEKIKEVYLVDVLGRTFHLPPQSHYKLDFNGLYLIFVKTETGTLFKDRIVFE